MQLDVTKKVRMSKGEARTLARLARKRHESEGQVLRDGLAVLARRQAREDNMDALIAMAEGETYVKIPFELK